MFRQLATASADDIRRRDRPAIVCGGTGLYIKALTKGLFVGPAQDTDVRKTLTLEAHGHGLRSLYERLEQVDPSATSVDSPARPPAHNSGAGGLRIDGQADERVAEGARFQ